MRHVFRFVYRMWSIMLAVAVVILVGFALFDPVLPQVVACAQ